MRFPLIKVTDMASDDSEPAIVVGSNLHHTLIVQDGGINFYNLQNGDGTCSPGGGYEFVAQNDYPAPSIEMVSITELLHIYAQETDIEGRGLIEEYTAAVKSIEAVLEKAKGRKSDKEKQMDAFARKLFAKAKGVSEEDIPEDSIVILEGR